ncbi:MAG TPA: hypothetical protein VM509_03890, partial [Planctomycetota bacterium]|nr:hypothetical protein [Planctomycetota bacterium]
MDFPLQLHSGQVALSAHFLAEALAYAAGFLLLQRERRRAGDSLGADVRWTLVVAAILGAALGSKLVHWTNEWPELARRA